MARRLTRKEIKHDIHEDAFRVRLFRTLEWLQENFRLVLAGILAVAAVAVAGVLYAGYVDDRREEAADQLGRAMRVYSAPIVEDGEAEPQDPATPSFPDEASRRERARTLMEEVRGMGGGSAGDVAGLYLADLAAREGDTETARRIWQEYLERHGDDLLAASVRLNLIYLDRQEGRAEEVAEQLRAELDGGGGTLPAEIVLFELAETLELLGQKEESQELFQRIIDEHPQSPYAAAARQKTV